MLSLPKILLTIAIIAAVFFIGKAISGRSRMMVKKNKRRGTSSGNEVTSVELSKCAMCDTFVGPDSPPCDRPECPQRI